MIMPVCQLGSEVEEKMNNMDLLGRLFLLCLLILVHVFAYCLFIVDQMVIGTPVELILGCCGFAGIMTTYFYVRFIRNKNKKNDE